VEFLRSNLVAGILSLLMLTGYASELFGECDDQRTGQSAMVLATNGDAKESPQQTSDECQCLCHQVFSDLTGVSIRLTESLIFTEIDYVVFSEFPPDAEPHAIEHPPQIA